MYRSRALKSHSKLKAAIGLRAAFGKFLLHRNASLCTVTFGEKVLTLAKSRGYCIQVRFMGELKTPKFPFEIN